MVQDSPVVAFGGSYGGMYVPILADPALLGGRESDGGTGLHAAGWRRGEQPWHRPCTACRGDSSQLGRFRIRYPNIIDGAIAASAPVWDFEGDTVPPAVYSFNEIITRDASAEGGSSPYCAVSTATDGDPPSWAEEL
jgi:hypothetical protein